MSEKCRKCKCSPCVCEELLEFKQTNSKIEYILCDLKSALMNWGYYRDRVKELEDILRILQYVGIHNEFGKCPECSGIDPREVELLDPKFDWCKLQIGHKDNCSIGKALKEKP
jgi:hypothetical protein